MGVIDIGVDIVMFKEIDGGICYLRVVMVLKKMICWCNNYSFLVMVSCCLGFKVCFILKMLMKLI